MIMGENGIIAKAQIAKEKTNESSEEEKEKLKKLEIAFGNRNDIDKITFDNDLIEFLTNTNYKLTLEDVFKSESAMNNILSNNDNVDYIINNKEKYMSYVVNNSSVMKQFASNEYAMNKIVQNGYWTQAILSSETAIAGLDSSSPTTVPTMTSNTTPSGEAFASSAYSGYEAWKAFDNTEWDSWGVGAGLSYKDQYVGYDFGKQIWVYKIEVKVLNGKQDTDYVIEASNDKTNWDIIKDGLHQDANKITIIPNNYNNKYRYYRVRLLSEIAQSGSGNTVIPIIQFYGK